MTALQIRAKYREDNDVTLCHGDCMKLLGVLPCRSVKLVITSPPYNIGKEYEQISDMNDYLERQERVVAECVRILKIGGSLCWQVGTHIDRAGFITPLDMAMHSIFEKYKNLWLRNRIVWHYEHGLNCKHRFSGRYETILWYTKGKRYAFDLDPVRVPQKYPGKKAYHGPNKGKYSCNPKGKNPGDVWIFPNVKENHVEKTIHPCQFPIELPERFVLALTKHNDLVVDPYFGVGTTGVAAVMHGRRVAGADIHAKYLAIAKQRIKRTRSGTVSYRPMLKPVYVPPQNTSLTTSPFNNNGRRL